MLLEKEPIAKMSFEVLDLFDSDKGNGVTDNRFDEDALRLQVLNLAVEAYRREEVSKGRLRDLSSVLNIKASEHSLTPTPKVLVCGRRSRKSLPPLVSRRRQQT